MTLWSGLHLPKCNQDHINLCQHHQVRLLAHMKLVTRKKHQTFHFFSQDKLQWLDPQHNTSLTWKPKRPSESLLVLIRVPALEWHYSILLHPHNVKSMLLFFVKVKQKTTRTLTAFPEVGICSVINTQALKWTLSGPGVWHSLESAMLLIISYSAL